MGEFSMNLTAPGTGPRSAAVATATTVPSVPAQVPVRPAPEQAERAVEPDAAAGKRSDARPVVEAAEIINRALAESQRELRFSVDEGTGRTLVYVMHPETGEVVRQIPSEVVLAMAEMLDRGERLSSLGLEVRS